MGNSHKYFENRDCRFYPCHNEENINCLFCYCPMYVLKHCLGNPTYKDKGDRVIKVCTNCSFPHKAENYDQIIEFLKNNKLDNIPL